MSQTSPSSSSSTFLTFFVPPVRTCAPLSRPQHGYLRCSGGGRGAGGGGSAGGGGGAGDGGGASYRAECVAGCERGYRLEGEARLTCLADSMWSGPQPRCVGKPSRTT
ncbi:hypothetical protein CRUP_020915 [Coryphaenoides rupestris]|nr:hypothetical protein CRUP_020915 [Coryphaenoides rupestris]